MRETLVRAIEIAFGLAHDQVPGPRQTHWPIELFWKCGQAWFEG
ncbi:MAG: hypothetical protein ACKO91_13540 [Acidimicrobiales bacterium]